MKFLLTWFILTFAIFQNQIPLESEISNSFRTKNTAQLARYFTSRINLSVDGTSEVYSNVQAEVVLRKKLSKLSIQDFSYLHKGVSKEGRYYIGTLSTSDGAYTVNINVIKKQQDWKINQLKIKKKD